jgi:hypothetical protein
MHMHEFTVYMTEVSIEVNAAVIVHIEFSGMWHCVVLLDDTTPIHLNPDDGDNIILWNITIT